MLAPPPSVHASGLLYVAAVVCDVKNCTTIGKPDAAKPETVVGLDAGISGLASPKDGIEHFRHFRVEVAALSGQATTAREEQSEQVQDKQQN